MKPRAYEVIPWKAIVPAQPVVDCTRLDWDQILRAQTVVITGTATDFFTTEAAQREAARMLRAALYGYAFSPPLSLSIRTPAGQAA